MKACKDCAHFWDYSFPLPPDARCRAPQRPEPVNVVYGNRPSSSAYEMRACETNCGPNAQWFEPKPEPKQKPSLLRRLLNRLDRTPAKPRIRKEGRHWVCRIDGDRWAGHGLTPRMAYGVWSTVRRPA
jgi:hypothetical protein